MMPLLAAVATIAILGGLALTVLGLVPTPVVPSKPKPASSRTRRAIASVTRRTKILFALGAIAGAVLALTTGWLVAVIVLPLATVGIPFLLSAPGAERQIARLEGMEEWTRALSGVLSIGQGIEQAILVSRRSTPESIRPEVTTLCARLESRWETAAALRAFADDLDDTTGDMISAALILSANRRGAGLAAVLSDLAKDVAEEVRARRAVEADRAKPRGTSRIITLITLIVLALLFLTGDYVAPYGTPIGQLTLFLLLSVYAGVLLSMRRMTRSDPPTRFVRKRETPQPDNRPQLTKAAVTR